MDPKGDSGLLSELHGLFVDFVPQGIRKIRTLIVNKNFQAIREEAHALKSSGSNLGVRRFSLLCETLENAENLTGEIAEQLISEIEQEFTEAQAALSDNIKKSA